MNADPVGNRTLHQRNNRSAHDRHDHDSRAVSGEGAEFRDAQSEDAGEHDGVEEAHQDDAPHGEVAGTEHGDCDESSGAHGANAEQAARFSFFARGRNR